MTECSIIYYIAYKTGYIQRSLTKKFRTMAQMTVRSAYAAVSPQDLQMKFRRAMAESDMVIVVGGLSAADGDNVMTVLSDYFTKWRLDVSFNKRIVNESGEDGYLIKTGSRYVLVLPDDPEAADRMFGAELLKNIDTEEGAREEIAEPVRTHSIVFAPEPDDSLDRLSTKRSSNLVLIIAIAIAAAVCIAAAVWVFAVYAGQ